MKYIAFISTNSTINTSEWSSVASAKNYVCDYIFEGIPKGEKCKWLIGTSLSAEDTIDYGSGIGGIGFTFTRH